MPRYVLRQEAYNRMCRPELILGIETSCDECAAAVVSGGRTILSDVIATQIPFHAPFSGVVPEIAGRKHAEWISGVVARALSEAGTNEARICGVAATSRPGLAGALLVGLSFAKTFAWARRLPFIAVNHLHAHLYAARLNTGGEVIPEYPFLGLLASGGHTIICRVTGYETFEVLGTTVDDAVGEAFDKVSKYYGWGYPGGKFVDELAEKGDASAFAFPLPSPSGGSACDVSYSGLKTAAIYQKESFRKKPETTDADIAASFRKAAVDTLLRALFTAVRETGLTVIVAGGGVAANSYLRSVLAGRKDLNVIFPKAELCGDNAAMVAALGYEYISRGITSPANISVSARMSCLRPEKK